MTKILHANKIRAHTKIAAKGITCEYLTNQHAQLGIHSKKDCEQAESIASTINSPPSHNIKKTLVPLYIDEFM